MTALLAGCKKVYAPGYNEADDDDNNYLAEEEADDYSWNPDEIVYITLGDTEITIEGEGAVADGNTVSISAGGTYSVTGTLSNGKIRIDSDDNSVVRIILNGVSINCLDSSPFFVRNAGKTLIILAENTENYLADGGTYLYEDSEAQEPAATIFSKSYVSFSGGGSLTVNAEFADGIVGKDGLVIKEGSIIVNSSDDGIRGKDYIIIHDGSISLTSAGDGLKSDNDSDTSLGFITIEKGKFNIASAGDALTAQTNVTIDYADMTLVSGGGSAAATQTLSAKGIKGEGIVKIEAGVFDINANDDAIHSNSTIKINGGIFSIATKDDAVHGDEVLEINGGDINISKCYEGLESPAITINAGTVHLISSDDGINAAGGPVTSSSFGPPAASGNLFINNGYIYVNSGGDGLDVNGSVIMKAGTVIINGPTSDGNGSIDYDGTYSMSGGFLVTAGSSGMAMAPSSSSTQCSLLVKFNSSQTSGKLFNIQTTDGTSLVTFAPVKQYRSVTFSSPDLMRGSAYSLHLGGTASGTIIDGLYSNETYSGGTSSNISISGTVTNIKLN